MEQQATASAEPHMESTVDATDAELAGAFFPNARGLRVTGGVYTSNVNVTTSATTPFEDFRKIPRSDIDLQREIRVEENSTVVHRGESRRAVRRVCSARVGQEKSERAVILYQGENAEEEWRQYVSRHSNIWHPNILQIFGVSTFSGIYAVIANDDLLTYKEFLEVLKPSFVGRAYLFASWNVQGAAADQAVTGAYVDTTHWIRHSTGRLCLDFTPSIDRLDQLKWLVPEQLFTVGPFLDLHNENWETRAVEALAWEAFNNYLFSWRGYPGYLPVPPETEVDLRMVVTVQLDDGSSCIVCLPDEYLAEQKFIAEWCFYGVHGQFMESGWTRFNAAKVCEGRIQCDTSLEIFNSIVQLWFSQANYVFKCAQLQVTSDWRAYNLVMGRHFWIRVSAAPTEAIPDGFLFLCPTEHLCSSQTTARWPEHPWFWSFDPTGESRLSEEDAARHGFPEITLGLSFETSSWDEDTYLGLREFHAAKGFDPDSQDIAIHLGYPPLELSWTEDAEESFAHVEEETTAPNLATDSETITSDGNESLDEDETPRSLNTDSSQVEEPVSAWSRQHAIEYIKLALILGSLLHAALTSYS